MKSTRTVVLTSLGLLLVTVSVGYAMSPPPASTDADVAPGASIAVWTDPGNGCQYLTRQGAITPRLHTDGVQVCNGPDLLGSQTYFDEYGEDPTGNYDAGDYPGENSTAEQIELLPAPIDSQAATLVHRVRF